MKFEVNVVLYANYENIKTDTMRTIPSSELIINDDGSIFHLHLKPEQLADIVILVGIPAA